MNKVEFEYDIPIQGEEDCNRQNEMCKEMFGDMYTPIKPTEEHMDILFEMIQEAIENIGDDGGWYVGDGIRVKIELEYEPENK